MPQPIALGINTDAYQPIERKFKLTRQLIEVMLETRHPFSLITKNALVERDIDARAAGRGEPGQRALLGDLAGPASFREAGTACISATCTAARDEAPA